MSLFAAVRPIFFSLDPELAHRLTINLLRLIPHRAPPRLDPRLAIEVAGLRFPSPIGLAAGFDKDAEVPRQMLALGFGSVEVGTLTPLPQSGNPTPRLFRLTEDRGVINRLGFNNGGQQAAIMRLQAKADGIIGVNVGANKDAADRIADYAIGVRVMAPVADYLAINISSPNTRGLRDLQSGEALGELLDAVNEARPAAGPPVFLKIAPDLDPAQIDAVVQAAMGKVDALIVGNTTVSRPALRSRHAHQGGGLSGTPLRDLAFQRLKDFYSASGGKIPLIGVGGVASGEDAYSRIRAGASLVQLYSSLVYEGPGLARRINAELIDHLERDGFAGIAEAVGAG